MQAQGKDQIAAKSKRSTVRTVHHTAVDVLLDTADDAKKPPRPEHCGCGEFLFMGAQLLTVLCIGMCTTYHKGDGETPGSATLPGKKAVEGAVFDPAKDYIQRLYAVFQDVHVMIFIGFGFLMTFVKTSSWSALAFNWIISAWALQWGILSTGFWHQIMEGKAELEPIRLDLEHLIIGDFAAGAAMITFGAVLGKINLQQMFFLVWWEMVCYGLNEAICQKILHVSDQGGSILVHVFGAYFGIAASYGFQPTRAGASQNMQSDYQSEMVAVVGSIFLWMYWPSFNGALAEGTTQHRIMCNTVLGITGSVMSAASTSRVLFGKLDMEIILNATLAGGVAVGSSCDLICQPWVALLVGMCGGILSSLGFAKIGPWLAQSQLNVQDTCGVHSLHGMPGVFAAIVSMIYLCTLEGKDFPAEYLYFTNPKNAVDGKPAGDHHTQAVANLKALIVTFTISIASGLIGGFICSLSFWKPVHALFRDDDHFHHVLQKYPKHYLEVSDEAIEYAKEAIYEIQALLLAGLPSDCVSKEDRIQWMGENVYDKIAKHDQELNKQEVLTFLNDYLATGKESFQDDDYHAEKLVPGAVFNRIFQLLDESANGRVHREEMLGYFYKLVENQASITLADSPSEQTKTSINAEGGEVRRRSKVNSYDEFLLEGFQRV